MRGSSQATVLGAFGLLCFSLLFATSARWPIGGDAALACSVAASLLDEGTPEVTSKRVDVHEGADGARYAKYSLLASALCAPGKLLERALLPHYTSDSAPVRLVLGAVPAAVGALLAVGFARLGLALGLSLGTALFAAALLLFTTPLWRYCRIYYGEGLQAAVATWLLVSVVALRRGVTPLRGIALGLLAGAALNVKALLVAVALAAPVDRVFEPRERRQWWRALAFAGVGAMPGVGAFLGYNLLRYGDALALGYDAERDGSIGFGVPLLSGLHGLLWSPGKSVFLYAPLLLFGLGALPALWRERRREVCLVAVPCLLTLLVVAKWWAWHGDWAWGPRLLVGVLPLAFLPVALALARVGRAGALALALLTGAGLGVQLLGVLVRPYDYFVLARQVLAKTPGTKQSPPPRDDLLLVHFVPEWSPIAGHAWLLGVLLDDDQEPAPWQSLRVRGWRVRASAEPPSLDLWFEARPRDTARWALLPIALLVFSLGWFWRALARASPRAPPPRPP